jgi:phosphate transport system protein
VSHYEERLQHDLDNIRERFRTTGAHVVTAVENATRSLLTFDQALASRTILGDMPINREIRELDRLCHFFVARHLPSAGILRFISSVLRLTIAVERIGDYAATMARQVVQLSAPLPERVRADIELMSEQSVPMLQQSLEAFVDGNAELARGTKAMAGQVDHSFDRVFADLLREGEKQSRELEDLFAMLIVFNRLERISDQAKNICEETIFAATGETKEPKVYRILFVDDANALWSPLARAIARKAFPESGVYESAGWSPAEALSPLFPGFCEEKGLDASGVQPRPIPTLHEEIDDFHVIVNLGTGLRERLADHPFKTILLDWDLLPKGGAEVDQETLEATYKKISFQIRELMETLRGQDAN